MKSSTALMPVGNGRTNRIVSSAAPPPSRPWSPPDALPLDRLAIRLPVPGDHAEALSAYNATVADLADTFSRDCRPARMNPLQVTFAEINADREHRRATLLEVLQRAHALAGEGAALAKKFSEAWTCERARLGKAHEKIEKESRKGLRQMYGDEPEARTRGRLSEVPAIKDSLAAQNAARNHHLSFDREVVRFGELAEQIETELEQLVAYLRK